MKGIEIFILVLIVIIGRVSGASGIDISGKFVNKIAGNTAASFQGVRVTLRNSLSTFEATSFVRPDGTFTVRDVPAGAYAVEFRAAGLALDPERLEVREGGKVKCRLYDERKSLLLVPVESAPKYFQERQRFNPLSLVKNPMVIMMGFSVLMMFVMPKLTANMAPEDRAQLMGDNKIALHDGRVIDRDALIPRWNPSSVSFPLRPLK